jgi:hypothetical protein
MGGEEDGGEVGSNGGAFQYVARKTAANRKRRKGREVQETKEEDKLSKRREIIANKKALLLSGDVGKQIEALLESAFPITINGAAKMLPKRVLALGLGSVKDSRASQLQLAFLLLVCEKLEKEHGGDGDDATGSSSTIDQKQAIQVEAYDPIFDEEDSKLLKSFQIAPLLVNVQGRYACQEATFVYMPHCTKTLYENLLRSNWSHEGLSRLWLCCNSLERYADRKNSDDLTPCISRIGTFFPRHTLDGDCDEE